jgi:hypothetical protein
MGNHVEDIFACNRCSGEFRSPRQRGDDQADIELPHNWLRLDLFEGDAMGIAQDGDASGSRPIEWHYCPTCKPKVLGSLDDWAGYAGYTRASGEPTAQLKELVTNGRLYVGHMPKEHDDQRHGSSRLCPECVEHRKHGVE